MEKQLGPPTSYHINCNPRWIVDLNVNSKLIATKKHLVGKAENNTGEDFYNLGVVKIFLTKILKILFIRKTLLTWIVFGLRTLVLERIKRQDPQCVDFICKAFRITTWFEVRNSWKTTISVQIREKYDATYSYRGYEWILKIFGI